ncbi:HVA22-like protein i [Glycine max]|nr:HVA22-like protein i [Glycine max]
MIGSFLTWALVMVFGYAYPAYECYKAVEKNKPEIEQLRFWCQYWYAFSMVPMYSEAKLAFFIFLWYPKTKGTTYVYDSFFRPYVAKHETEIDRNLLELRTRAGDIAVSYWQRAFSYGQTRMYDILQFVAAQSTPAPRPAQQRPGVRVRQPAPAKPAAAAAAEPQVEEPPSPTSSTSSSLLQREVEEELGSSPQVPKAPPSSVASLSNQKTPVAEAEPKQIEAAPSSSSSANENGNPSTSTKETLMEESIRVTRGRLRKTRSAGTR